MICENRTPYYGHGIIVIARIQCTHVVRPRDLLRRAAYHRSAGLSWDAAAARFPAPVVTGAELEEMAQTLPDDYNSFFRTFQKRRIWELQNQALNSLAGLLEAADPSVVLRAADIICRVNAVLCYREVAELRAQAAARARPGGLGDGIAEHSDSRDRDDHVSPLSRVKSSGGTIPVPVSSTAPCGCSFSRNSQAARLSGVRAIWASVVCPSNAVFRRAR